MALNHPIRAHAALTDVGLRRHRNEDAVLVIPEWGVFCVCDGIGGAMGGDEASRTVVFAIQEVFRNPAVPAAMTAHAFRVLMVSQAIREAGRRIRESAAAQDVEGMGSTVTALLFDRVGSGRATLLHAGDSPAFRLRGDEMVRLVEPHVVEARFEPASEGNAVRLGTLLSRAVGIDADMRLEPNYVDVQSGDIFLLCTDGLTIHLEPVEIAEQLWRCRKAGPLPVVHKLIELANLRGGRDNITAVVIQCM